MKLNRIKTILSSVILGGLMVSCGPDKVGPELKGASSSFNKNVSFSFNHVTTNLGAEVMETELAEKIDFGANEEGFFTSTKFNEKVSWTITASGYGSGAVAQFSGTSDKINYDNSLWLYGRSSNVFFFQKKEFVKFELDIVGLDTTYTVDSVSVGRVRYWHKKDINGVGYVIIDAFDDDLPTLGLSATGPDNNDLDVKISVTDLNKVEGSSSLYLTGTDLNNNGWVGGRNHERLLELHEGLVIDSGIDEDELFFNIFIHGDSKIGNTTISCKINGQDATLQTILYNGDTVKIINSKNVSPSLHWLSSAKTGKARSSIRRYWKDKLEDQAVKKEKQYYSTLAVDLPDEPGMLGEVSTLIGLNGFNILNVEYLEKKDKIIKFLFDLQINDLKDFTNLISQIKQKNLVFRIIRHKKRKKNDFIQRIFKNFKRD